MSFFRTKYQTECISNIIQEPHTLNKLHHSRLYLDAKFLFHTRHVVAEKEFITAWIISQLHPLWIEFSKMMPPYSPPSPTPTMDRMLVHSSDNNGLQ